MGGTAVVLLEEEEDNRALSLPPIPMLLLTGTPCNTRVGIIHHESCSTTQIIIAVASDVALTHVQKGRIGILRALSKRLGQFI